MPQFVFRTCFVACYLFIGSCSTPTAGQTSKLTVHVSLDTSVELSPGLTLGDAIAARLEPELTNAIFMAFGHEHSDEAYVERLPIPLDGQVATFHFANLQRGKWWVTFELPWLRLDRDDLAELVCTFQGPVELDKDVSIDIQVTPKFEQAPTLITIDSSVRESAETWEWRITKVGSDNPYWHGDRGTEAPALAWLDSGDYQLVAKQGTSQGAFYAVSNFRVGEDGYRGRVATSDDRIKIHARFELPEGHSNGWNAQDFHITQIGHIEIHQWIHSETWQFDDDKLDLDLGYLPRNTVIVHDDGKQHWRLTKSTELVITEGGIDRAEIMTWLSDD